MSCPYIGKLCKKFILSQSVVFDGDALIINIPAGSYQDDEKYCLVIAQTIPANTRITTPVVITIGTGTTRYPLMHCDCTTVYAPSLSTRTRYSTRVETSIGGGVFKLLGDINCANSITTPPALPIE